MREYAIKVSSFLTRLYVDGEAASVILAAGKSLLEIYGFDVSKMAIVFLDDMVTILPKDNL